MADKLEISRSSVANQMANLKNHRIKNRMGSNKSGKWIYNFTTNLNSFCKRSGKKSELRLNRVENYLKIEKQNQLK